MTRPCSIARGNCEPKTIKCQIYDTDQFTMIWRKTVLPFFIHFFLRIFFLLSLSRIWGWVSDTKKDTRSSLLYEASQSNVDNAAKCNGKWKSKWAARDAEDNSSSRRRKEGGGEVKAGVATRWLIPSSISSRSNCWTLLNMTYLWSASCGTKGEAKLQLGNAQWKW